VLWAQFIFVLVLAPLQGSYIFALGKLFHKENNNLLFAIIFAFPTALFSRTAPLVCSYSIHFLNWLSFPGFYLIGRPEEIAELVYFLAQNQAAYITGAFIPIDSGYTKK